MTNKKYTTMSVYAVKYECFDTILKKFVDGYDIAYFVNVDEALDFTLDMLIEGGYDDYSMDEFTIEVVNEDGTYQHLYKLEELRVGKYMPDWSIRKVVRWM